MGADASVQRDHLNLNDLDRQAKHLLHSGIAHLVMARRCDLSADDISQVECVRDRFLEFAQSIYDHMLVAYPVVPGSSISSVCAVSNA